VTVQSDSVTVLGSAIPKDGMSSLTDANVFGVPLAVARGLVLLSEVIDVD
jgi:hypothetical protein